MFQPLNHPPCPSLDFLKGVQVLRSPELDAELQGVLNSAEQRGRITSLDLPAATLLTQPGVPLA